MKPAIIVHLSTFASQVSRSKDFVKGRKPKTERFKTAHYRGKLGGVPVHVTYSVDDTMKEIKLRGIFVCE